MIKILTKTVKNAFLVNLLAQNPKRIVIFLEFYDFTNDWARKHGLDKNSETTPTNGG